MNHFMFGVRALTDTKFGIGLMTDCLMDLPSYSCGRQERPNGQRQTRQSQLRFVVSVAKHTDGYAPQSKIPASRRTSLCWVLRSEKELKEHEDWMRQSGRVCVIENTR